MSDNVKLEDGLPLWVTAREYADALGYTKRAVLRLFQSLPVGYCKLCKDGKLRAYRLYLPRKKRPRGNPLFADSVWQSANRSKRCG